jgi:hypothetical protein
VSQAREEFLYLGDGYMVFSSADSQKLKGVLDLAKEFDLKIITDIREAWV